MTLQYSVLVTGGAGYIGSHTTLALQAAGHDVVVIDNLSTGDRNLVAEGVSFIEGDVADTRLVRRVLREHRVGAVIHFAGSIVNPESFEQPLAYYANNTSASRNLLEACVAEGVETFLFSSSASVYGEVERLPIDETDPTNPASPYGASKLMTEWMLRDIGAAHNLQWGALRYFNVAGADAALRAGQVGPATHLIKIAVEVAVGARKGMEIFGDDYGTPDGTCIRDYVHVSDLADAHVAALEHLQTGQSELILNCGYGHGYSVHDIIEAVERVSGQPLNARVAERRIGDTSKLVADNRRILRTLDWAPKFNTIDTIISSALAWEQKRRGL